MEKKELKKTINLTTILYAWIVGVSIVFYILIVFCGIDLPYSIIQYPNNISDYPDFRNYIFLLNPDEYNIFCRFRSIFTEPGHLGMISALLLYVNKYEIKRKSVLVIFISILLSFSLAAYVLLIFGYCIFEFVNKIGKLIKLIKLTVNFIVGILLLIAISLYVYAQYSDSIVSQLIIHRLEYDEDKGIIGNNRNSSHFDYFYENNFYRSSDCIFGIGETQYMDKLAGKTSSYKAYIVQYGIVGIFFLFIFYLSIIYVFKSNLLFGLLILYCASFWQRPYALWEMQLFLFMGAAELFRIKNEDIPNCADNVNQRLET
jgi:hypothetical protein